MKFNVYAVKDIKKGVFLQPWFVPFYVNEEQVKVDFERNLKSAESIISKFPDDFQLWKLGAWMDETGAIIEEQFTLIVSAADLLKEEKKDNDNSTESEII